MPFDFTILLMVWLKCAIATESGTGFWVCVWSPAPNQELMGFEIKPINPRCSK